MLNKRLWNEGSGHLNTLVCDHDSIVTAFGKHDRVVAFCPQANKLYCRVDHKWELGMPTEKQVLTVARKSQGVKGKWRLVSRDNWTNRQPGDCTDFNFERVIL